MRLQQRFIVSLLGLFLSSQAFGWGYIGHRTIANIASNHLCPQAKKETQRILKGQSMADAATWADELREDTSYDYLKPYHYVIIERGETYATSNKNPKGDVVAGIRNQIQIIRDPSVRDDARNVAMKLLLHFVGDAHQPMHAGYKSSLGGNKLAIDWFGKVTSMHGFWDREIITKTGETPEQMAQTLDNASQPGWNVPQQSPEVWVQESSQLNDTIETDFWAMKKKEDPMIPMKLPASYYDKNVGTAKKRVLEAGLRLANTLNAMFGCR